MVGSNKPIGLSRSRIERMLSDPATRQVLALMNVETFDHLARTFRAGPEQLQKLVGSGPHLTDDRPLIEYFAPSPTGAAVQIDQFRADIHSILRP